MLTQERRLGSNLKEEGLSSSKILVEEVDKRKLSQSIVIVLAG